jgi:3-keto-disaccharide hydrolase
VQDPIMSRRRLFEVALTALGAYGLGSSRTGLAAPPEIKMPDGVTEQKFDFETKGIEGWTQVGGQWGVEEFPGAPVGRKALLQRATKNEFNVIVAPAGPFTDVDVSVKFDPLSGKEDASGGIVFRFTNDKYYVVRANALEGNFRLYAYDRGRRQLASASVKPPALGQWHLLRVVVVGDHIQGWLDGALLLDYRDSRFKSGWVGLWTKADSITAFNDFTIRGVTGGA